MSVLVPPADLEQLRRQAKDLLRAAKRGEPAALARIGTVSDRLILSAAQLTLAREFGFESWARLKLEVERRHVLDAVDVIRLRELATAHPELATMEMRGWCDHPLGISPLGYLAAMPFDAVRSAWRIVEGTGPLARELLRAGAPVDGAPGDPETPLITAASYGNTDVAKVLVEAGASLTATASPDAGGVPNGTALRHAVVFGMTEVADALLAAGAGDLVHAAATGSVAQCLTPATREADRVAALRIAAERGHLSVIDDLLTAGTPLEGLDRDGSTALHAAAYYGQAAGVRHLIEYGADPTRRDTRFDSTPLGWSRAGRRDEVGPERGHDQAERILAPLSPDD